ncbi:hypothetical protein HELRODRAFT_127096, partial [Helobdella robusta]|uniref:Cadherin domain-containing protein n=1 Tax=Helobdella robusta TaxID=6412 RepID=T1EHC9_HELRO
SGSIFTKSPLDYEMERSYWLVIEASNQASRPIGSQIEVYVGVVNVNDNAPITEEMLYYASIPENSPANTPIITLVARDDDDD